MALDPNELYLRVARARWQASRLALQVAQAELRLRLYRGATLDGDTPREPDRLAECGFCGAPVPCSEHAELAEIS